MAEASMAFASFMAKPLGRGLRIAVGAALIGSGFARRDTTSGVALMIGGVVPLLAGLLNLCVLAPIIGAPFSGRDAQGNGTGAGDHR